jgi:single-strand DNA-binding protein
MNHVILIGRLVADPETRYTQNGVAVCNFTIAVDRKFKNQSGEKESDFLNCVAWRKAAELIGQYMSKGRRIGVQGTLQSRKYQDRDGNNRTAYEIVVDEFEFLDSGGAGSGSGGGGGGGGGYQKPAARSGPGSGPGSIPPPEPPPDNMMDDDLPF